MAGKPRTVKVDKLSDHEEALSEKKTEKPASEGQIFSPVSLPSKNRKDPRKDVVPDTVRIMLENQPNGCGVIYDPLKDNCFHLNAGWKRGVCTIQGNSPCPFLGGNQGECPQFVSKEEIAKLSPSERRKLPFGKLR